MEVLKKNKKLVIIGIIILGVIIMWTRSCRVEKEETGEAKGEKKAWFFGKRAKQGEAEAPQEIVPVKIAKVVKKDFSDMLPALGTIKGFKEIPVKFSEYGRIEKFGFKEGDRIKQSEIVVAQEQKDAALKLEYAGIEYEKNKKIHALGGITDDKLRQSDLELQSAQWEVDKKTFRAPCDGYMGTRLVEEGEMVTQNDKVTTFVTIDNVYCEIGTIEKDMNKVKVGQKAALTFDAYKNKSFEGTVDSVSPLMEGRSRTQTVKILVPNPEELLRPGMFAKVAITTYEQKDAVVIPRSALKKTEEGGYVVYAVTRPEGEPKKTEAGNELVTAKEIPVKIGYASEQEALISEGLSEGQEIIVETPEAKEKLADGGTVEIIGVIE